MPNMKTRLVTLVSVEALGLGVAAPVSALTLEARDGLALILGSGGGLSTSQTRVRDDRHGWRKPRYGHDVPSGRDYGTRYRRDGCR